jgi:FkbM family methyltransferase
MSVYTIKIPNGLSIKIAIPANTDSDQIAQNIKTDAFRYGWPLRLFLCLTQPGTRVLDLGGHIGTLSLAAAALGCDVATVEASPQNYALLMESIEKNQYRNIRVFNRFISDTPGTVSFVESGPASRMAYSPQDTSNALEVNTITGLELLDAIGWDRPDYIKLDVEGMEIPALRGMEPILRKDDAPPIVYESNSAAMYRYGFSVADLRTLLEEFGYKNYLIDENRLRPIAREDVQVLTVVDHLAVKENFDANSLNKCSPRFQFAPAPNREQIIEQILLQARNKRKPHRQALARALAQLGDDVTSDDRVQAVLAELKDVI